MKNKKLSLDSISNFSNLYLILNICEKMMTVIADVFAEVPGPKNMVR